MSGIRVGLAVMGGIYYGLWQGHLAASVWMFVVLLFVASVDRSIEKLAEDD